MGSDDEGTGSSLANTSPPEREGATGLDEIVDQLQHDGAAWCATRPDASNLSMGEVYNDLNHLDIMEQSLLPRKEPEIYYSSWQPKPAALVLRDVKRAAVQGSFAPRRQLLRSRAMDLSRHGLRSFKITDLPLDILRIIFSHFQDDAITEGRDRGHAVVWYRYHAGSTEKRRTVRSLRLVSLLFCELAIPLLFPILQVQLSQSSLDLAEKIANNPAIAAGVRGIRVSLAYRPKEIADDITRYLNMRLTLLQDEGGCYEFQYEPYLYWGLDHSEDGEDGAGVARLCQALDTCHLLREEWQKYMTAVGCGETPEEPLHEQQERFQEGFCRLQREQYRLLQEATFATALATAVARMPNARSLTFVDEPGPHVDFGNASLLADLDMIPVYLPPALTWQEFEDENEEAEGPAAGLECARVLWELPIALHRAGVTLTELNITKLPLYNHFSMLRPKDDTGTPLYEELSAECAKLEVFDLSVSGCRGIRHHYLPDQDQSHIDDVLGVMLAGCSHHLRALGFDFYALSINSGRGGQRLEGGFPSDAFITQLQELPRLRQLHLNHVELQQKTFKELCSNIGRELDRL
ncbi:hypothetical protein VTI74DRAFT_1205 [Chaetomium olivicolor]